MIVDPLLMESLGRGPLARFRGSFPIAGPGEFGGSQNPLAFPQEAELERLEREFAIQSQITEAARRLASDPNVSKKLKKQRKTSYLNALKKLQEIENAINEYRIKSGKKPTQRASLIIDGKWDLAPMASRKDLWTESKILALRHRFCLPPLPSPVWRTPRLLAVGLSSPVPSCCQMGVWAACRALGMCWFTAQEAVSRCRL